LDNYLKNTDEIIAQYEWSDEEKGEIEFMRDVKILGYHASFTNNSDEIQKHCQKVVGYAHHSKRLDHVHSAFNSMMELNVIQLSESEEMLSILENIVESSF
jgi:hypothetical protein